MFSTRNRAAELGLLMILVTLLANAALAYLNLYRLRENDDIVAHTHEVLIELKTLLTTVVDAETGQRGFLITGDSGYLEPYQKAVESVKSHSAKLQRLVADNPEQKAALAKLQQPLAERMELLRQGIAIREQGPDESRSFILAGKGRMAMEAVRKILNEIEQREQRLLVERSRESRISYWTALATIGITAILSLVLAGGGYFLLLRDLLRQRKLASVVQVAKEQLEEKVRERTAALSDANAALRTEVETRTQAEEHAQQFAAELQRSNRELEQFASVASHDLQEPLRKIQAFSDRLQAQFSGQLGEKGQDYLDRMIASAGRMRKLIDDLLAFSRVATKVQPFTPIQLGDLAREVVSDLEARLQQTGGRIEISKLPTIEADPLQMRQLLQNLIGNGLKFHRPGVPPLVQVTSRIIPAVMTSAAGDSSLGLQCEISVQDNGIGFEQVYVDRIFELFQRLHGRDEYEGTGMGLAICRKIVERHGGGITAVSSPGQGARFIVTLPLTHSAAGAAA